MNLLITQARMGSTRLPGKVLKTIKGYTLLELQLERVKKSKLVDQIVVATTTDPQDDPIEEFCKGRGIACHRGSEQDVLDRYYQAARKYNPETVIRITSDCPLHHHEVIDFVMEEYQKSGKDYFSNSNKEPDFLEDGFDVEVFSMTALETAWKEAKLQSEREHVTVYIKNCGKFKCGWKKYNPNYTFKLSVDSPADYKLATEIFESFDSITDFGLNDVVELLQIKPELLEINKESEINSGLKKSLRNDKIV